jgi:hypothetical protein
MVDKSGGGTQEDMTVGQEKIKTIYGDLMCPIAKQTITYPLDGVENQQREQKENIKDRRKDIPQKFVHTVYNLPSSNSSLVFSNAATLMLSVILPLRAIWYASSKGSLRSTSSSVSSGAAVPMVKSRAT